MDSGYKNHYSKFGNILSILFMGVLAVDVHGVLGVGEAAVVHEAEEGEESPPSCVAKHDAVRLQDSFTQKTKWRPSVCKNSNY